MRVQPRVQTGTLVSGLGHAGLILWVILGDWLFASAPADQVIVTQVSMMTSAEFDALQAAASTPTPSPEPAPKPQPRPEPKPEPAPAPAPAPEPVVEPTPAPEPVPEDLPTAAEEQLLPSPSQEEQAVPDAAEIVAPVPTDVPEDAQTSDTPTPAVSDQPTAEPVVPQEPTEATVAEATGTVLQTEANRDQTEALGMTASIRPRAKPERPPEPAPEDVAAEVAAAVDAPQDQPADEPAAEAPTEDAVADALAEALAEDTSDPTSDTGGSDLPQGPPLTAGEVGDVRSAIGNKWNLGSASTDALRTTIVVRVSFSPEGQPTDIELLESDGPTEAATSTAFSAARRAVLRASQDGGIPLPADKYDTWRVLDLVFDPNGMRLR